MFTNKMANFRKKLLFSPKLFTLSHLDTLVQKCPKEFEDWKEDFFVPAIMAENVPLVNELRRRGAKGRDLNKSYSTGYTNLVEAIY